jgi:2-keto-4-pentenoate hydratase
MEKTRLKRAADILIGHYKNNTRLAALPPDCAPVSRAEAYAVQQHWDLLSTVPRAGWKIAATSIAGQKHIGVDGPLAGRYSAERTVASGASIPFGNNHMRVAEIEFAFRMGRTLPPRAEPYLEAEVFAAIASLHPAIEIPDSRYDRFETVGGPSLIADNACANWLCVGEAFPDRWRDIDLATFEPTGEVSGAPPVIGRGANVLGSPHIAMTWLANELSAHGIPLQSGEIVSTGTCVVPMPVVSGSTVHGTFPGLGGITLTLT